MANVSRNDGECNCILRWRAICSALIDVHPECGTPGCPFYKNKEMELESRKKAIARANRHGIPFVDKVPAGWDL